MTRRELICLAASAPLARAQFTASVQVVNLQVTVRTKAGQVVRGLLKDDFEVTDEGKKQEIRYFSADSDQPLTIGLLFDTSGSQRSLVIQQLAASLGFLNQVLRPDDRAFVAGFDQRIRLTQEQTDDRGLLEAGLKRLAADDVRATGTAVFDAVVHAAERLQRESGRKVIVLLSDGQDTASTASVKEAIEEAQRANASVYTVRIYDREVFALQVPSIASRNLEDGRIALKKMAEQTGGRIFDDASTSLETAFSELNQELRAQYSLGYPPPGGKAGYRKVRVRLKPKDLVAQVRDGYFTTG